MNISTPGKLCFNPSSPDFSQNLYQVYDHMQQHQPLLRLGRTWVLTRYSDVSAALKEPRLGSAGIPQHLLAEYRRQEIQLSEPLQAVVREIVLFQDGHEHRTHRKAIMALFNGAPYQELKQLVQDEIRQLVASQKGEENIDGIAQLANLVWPRLFARWLNLTDEQCIIVERQKENIRLLLDPSAIDSAGLQKLMSALHQLEATFNQLLQLHFTGRPSPFYAALIQGYQQDESQLRRYFSTDCITVLIGGSETSGALIGNLLHILAVDPHLQTQLREQPSLIRQSVTETMRYESPLQMARRTVLEPVTLHQRELRVHDSVLLCLGAANRDESQFAEAGQFLPGRVNSGKHLGFGHGVHLCVGQLLAQFQAETLCSELLAVLPPFRLNAAVQWQRDSLILRSLASLPLRVSR